MSEFKFFDRGYNATTLLIPGWASDWRIFNTLNLDSNYLIPTLFSPFDFDKGLLDILNQNGLKKIAVMGWSMGGFIAYGLLLKYQDIINEAVLISVRRRYEKENIENIKTYLKKNARAFLYKFYKDCFSANEKEELAWFKDNLLKEYLGLRGSDMLFEGLDYLSNAEINEMNTNDTKLRLIHGEEDRIAPIKDAYELKKIMPKAELVVVNGSGHMPFLNSNFNRILND